VHIPPTLFRIRSLKFSRSSSNSLRSCSRMISRICFSSSKSIVARDGSEAPPQTAENVSRDGLRFAATQYLQALLRRASTSRQARRRLASFVTILALRDVWGPSTSHGDELAGNRRQKL